jgi:maleylacetate reductase
VNRFTYQLRPVRVVFGAGAAGELGAELSRAGCTRALLLATPGRRELLDRLDAVLGDLSVGRFDRAQLHVPAAVVEAAGHDVDRLRPDCLVSVGGGSAIGLGKALAVERHLPLVSMPTTYSGSEMTDIWGMTREHAKSTSRSIHAAPAIVIYDPELTLSLSAAVSAASGMNGVAHAVEALYAFDANPLASLLAEAALHGFATALPVVVRDRSNIGARTVALRAAHLAGVALNQTSMGLHHKLCHVLGGSFGLPHADTHAALLPHATAYNRDHAREAMATIARAIGSADAAEGLDALNRQLGVVRSLRELGLKAEHLDRVADLAMTATYPNPRPVTREGVRAILDDAFNGRAPR